MFKCSICGRAMKRKLGMLIGFMLDIRRHSRAVHFKVKPHHCLNCGKSFTREELLLRHNKRRCCKQDENEDQPNDPVKCL
jgi:hypothetical protein